MINLTSDKIRTDIVKNKLSFITKLYLTKTNYITYAYNYIVTINGNFIIYYIENIFKKVYNSFDLSLIRSVQKW